MNNNSLKNVNQNDVEDVQRGYKNKTAQLPRLTRGSFLAQNISESWFKGIFEKAGEQNSNDGALLRAKYAHKSLVDSIDALEKLRDSRNPNDTPAVHLQKIAKASEKLIEATAKQFDAVRGEINLRRQEIKSQIKERLGLDTTSTQTNEIRGIIRSMSEKDRVTAISEAIEARDSVILSAIWDAHTVTVGVKPELLTSLKNMATHKHAGDLVALREALDQSEDLLLNSFDSTLDIATTSVSGDAVRKFKEETEKADLAAAGFANLLGGGE